MIEIAELDKRINEILKVFKKRTKVMACSVLDKDGFIIASLKDDFMENYLYYKDIVALYTALESLAEKKGGLVDFQKRRELISFGLVDDYFNNGFMILIKVIGDNIVFLSIFPTLLNLRSIYEEFDKAVDELSMYFLNPEFKNKLSQLYTLV